MGGLFPLEPFYPLHGELCLALWGRAVTLPREYRCFLLISEAMSWAVIAPPCGILDLPTGRHRYSFDPYGAEGRHCPMQGSAQLVMEGLKQIQQNPLYPPAPTHGLA